MCVLVYRLMAQLALADIAGAMGCISYSTSYRIQVPGVEHRENIFAAEVGIMQCGDRAKMSR